jgi:hypothetical protein
MEIRRLVVVKDVIHIEAGLAAVAPVTRVAACAIIANPSAGKAMDDLSELIGYGATLGEHLVQQALGALAKPVISYGKAAIIGVNGDVEHGAAIMHPRMGKPIRDAIGGGQALIPSNVKIGAAGAGIDVPLGHKDDPWSFDEIDTITVTIAGAPRPDEIVAIVALADGGRPRPRVAKSGAVPPRAR